MVTIHRLAYLDMSRFTIQAPSACFSVEPNSVGHDMRLLDRHIKGSTLRFRNGAGEKSTRGGTSPCDSFWPCLVYIHATEPYLMCLDFEKTA
jgi:hypothetical protein